MGPVSVVCAALFTHTQLKKKGNLCGFPELLTHTCITRAERTKLHLQVLCVRLNVKQVQTCLGLGLFFLKPQEPLKSGRWSRWRDRQRGRGGGGEAASLLWRQVKSAERFGKVSRIKQTGVLGIKSWRIRRPTCWGGEEATCTPLGPR